jgi:hypothetical protein
MFVNLPRDYNSNNKDCLWEGIVEDSDLVLLGNSTSSRTFKINLTSIKSNKAILTQSLKSFGWTPASAKNNEIDNFYSLSILPSGTIFSTQYLVSSAKHIASIFGPSISGVLGTLIQADN